MTIASECKFSCWHLIFFGFFKKLKQLVFQGFFRQFAFYQLSERRVKCMTADGLALGNQIGAFKADSKNGDPGVA